MSRKTKVINSSKFLNVITLLLERQEKLLQHINDLEEYVEILEGINDFENGETFIDFTPDEEFIQALEEGLTVEQKDKVNFHKLLEEMFSLVRKYGTEVPIDELVESDLVLPEPDITLQEAEEMFTGEGLVPD